MTSQETSPFARGLIAVLIGSMVLFYGCSDHNQDSPNLQEEPSMEQPIGDEEPFAYEEAPSQGGSEQDEEIEEPARIGA